MTFGTGESALSGWMADNVLVSWVEHVRPWELENELFGSLDLPLNLASNAQNAFHSTLTAMRAAAVTRARSLPVLPNPGVGGR